MSTAEPGPEFFRGPQIVANGKIIYMQLVNLECYNRNKCSLSW